MQKQGKRLEALPGWSWDAVADRWEEGFQYLSAFVRQEGHARVPDKHHENGFRLGQWVRIQRSVHKQGKLSPERIERLEALPGWTWDPRSDRWEEGFLHLAAFVEREGHARVPRDHGKGGFRLGQWGHKKPASIQRAREACFATGDSTGSPPWLVMGDTRRTGRGVLLPRKITRIGGPRRTTRVPTTHDNANPGHHSSDSDGA